ncbi:hypothetical protein ACW9HR_37140 [Nocardia gipuzkoensis]
MDKLSLDEYVQLLQARADAWLAVNPPNDEDSVIVPEFTPKPTPIVALPTSGVLAERRNRSTTRWTAWRNRPRPLAAGDVALGHKRTAQLQARQDDRLARYAQWLKQLSHVEDEGCAQLNVAHATGRRSNTNDVAWLNHRAVSQMGETMGEVVRVDYIGMDTPPEKWQQPVWEALADVTEDISLADEGWTDPATVKAGPPFESGWMVITPAHDGTVAYLFPRHVQNLSARVWAGPSQVHVDAPGALDWFLTSLVLMPYGSMRFQRMKQRVVVDIQPVDDIDRFLRFEFTA